MNQNAGQSRLVVKNKEGILMLNYGSDTLLQQYYQRDTQMFIIM
jgi:hypothetical protein